MSYLSRILAVSFSGYRFPIKDLSIKGSLRHFAHEYPHAPGAALETMGRKLYEIRMTPLFHETFDEYPLLLETAATLRTLFEGEQAWDLAIPHIGVISAKCIDWEDNLIGRVTSGYESKFTFLEDQSKQFLAEKLVTTSQQILPAADLLVQLVAARDLTPFYTSFDDPARAAALANEEKLFTDVFSAVDKLTAAEGTTQLYGDAVASKAQAVETACNRAREGCKSLVDWRSYRILRALGDVQANARERRQDAQRSGRAPAIYVTKGLMSVSQIAAAIYGDTMRAADLLRYNAFDDAFAIPSGTKVTYYPDPSSRRAAA